jgi:hypothetical protein
MDKKPSRYYQLKSADEILKENEDTLVDEDSESYTYSARGQPDQAAVVWHPKSKNNQK